MVFKPRYVIEGMPGHPVHPPLTDATIGTFTLAAVLAVVDAVEISDSAAAHGWWLALLVGLVFAAVTAVTGFVDWLKITRGTPLWRTATSHALANVTAVVLFGLAAIFGHDDWNRGDVTAGPLILTLLGLAALTLGGWLGGTIVFVYGMRVLNRNEPARVAASPHTEPGEEAAERG